MKSKAFEGVQIISTPNMVLWHKGYFKLKAIENQQIQEGFFALP